MCPAAITLGPFALQRPIGAGGMGEVWQGVHAEEHVPVAIKVSKGVIMPTYGQWATRLVREHDVLITPALGDFSASDFQHAAKAIAIALPIPLLAPVTIAT